jgi:hypothetical protein
MRLFLRLLNPKLLSRCQKFNRLRVVQHLNSKRLGRYQKKTIAWMLSNQTHHSKPFASDES